MEEKDYFFKFNFCGQEVKADHCCITRTVLSVLMLAAIFTVFIIVIQSFVE